MSRPQLQGLEPLCGERVVQSLMRSAGPVACHLVGGVLRDRLLGIETRDFDAVVAGDGLGIARRLSETLPARLVHLGGKEFASYRLVGRAFTLDLWDRQGQSLDSDLRRRDLTVNAMALDVTQHRLLDPYEGLRDLRSGVLRATTGQVFLADPLRVLRLARLLVQLPAFEAVPETVALARQAVAGLSAVAHERIHEELRLTLSRAEAHRGLALLIDLRIYPGLWLNRVGEVEDLGEALPQMAHLTACAEELRQVADRLGAELAVPTGPDLAPARWAILIANLPPSETAPDRVLIDCQRRGLLSRRETGAVGTVLSWSQLPDRESGLRRLLAQTGPLWPVTACYLGARSFGRGGEDLWRRFLERLVGLLQSEGSSLLSPPALVTGLDVQRILGLCPGPSVGEALAQVRAAQIEGSIATREQALKFLRGKR